MESLLRRSSSSPNENYFAALKLFKLALVKDMRSHVSFVLRPKWDSREVVKIIKYSPNILRNVLVLLLFQFAGTQEVKHLKPHCNEQGKNCFSSLSVAKFGIWDPKELKLVSYSPNYKCVSPYFSEIKYIDKHFCDCL